MSKVINIKKEPKSDGHKIAKDFDKQIAEAQKVDHIIAGTESAYKIDVKDPEEVKANKPSKKEVSSYMKKFKEYKDKYIKDNTIESMVYENGSALALLYKEITRLNQLLTTNLKRQDEKK
jgi:hypothetical protein